MSNKKDIQEMLVSMGFKPNYITRAFKVYEKNYGHSYNVEVITEIIVRLQNKDKAKQKNKGSDKDKSPQPPSKDKSKDKGNKNKDNKKDKSNKSPPKQSKSSKDPSKSSKNIKKEQQQQVNISAGSGSKSSSSSSNNKRMSGKMNNGGKGGNNNNNAMNTDPPPKAFASHTQYQSYDNNNMPMMDMSRSQSGGRKKKPNKPPPANPLPNKPSASSHRQPQFGNHNSNSSNSNNQGAPPKIHAKSQTAMIQSSYNNKPQRQSPVPPPRFNKGDTVWYQNQEAEVMRIVNQNQIEITYPRQNFIMQRHKAVVQPRDLQRKKAGPPQSAQYGQNNNSGNQSPQRGQHQYSQSSSGYHQYQNGGNNGNNQQRNTINNPLSNNNQVNISMNNSNSHNKNNGNSNNSPPRNSKTITPSPNKKVQNTQNGSTSGSLQKKATSGSGSGSMPTFESHMQLQDAFKLKVHDKIDHRDQVGRFVYATVSEKQGTNLKIHYDGWSRKWDTWSDFQKEIHRFAKAGSISKRPAHRFKQLKKGDYVDINPTQRHPGWKCGEIRRLDQKSGQVQVVYESADKNYLYWAHLDNKHEIAEFTSRSGTVHATQVDMLQKQNQGGGQQQGQYDMNNNKSMQQRPMQYQQQVVNQQQYNAQQQQQYNQQQQMMMAAAQQEPMDEMEAFERIRAKRFPRYPNERIDNPYGIGDWLEVQDTQTHQWITATVIDKENNWIVVHFDGWPSKYDQKIHAVKHKKRLRALGSGLQETQEEKDIKEEMANFLKEVEQLNWKLVEVDADGNCLYRCFGIEIYGDTERHMEVRNECCKYMRDHMNFFQNFIPDFESRMKEKETEYEWGDHVDITALSELYNVRVRVFEYDKDQKKLYMSFDQGEHEETVNLPLILLARHRKKHYNIIIDPQAINKRPLGTTKDRMLKAKQAGQQYVNLRDLRLREDAKENESKDEEKDVGDNNGGNGDIQMADNQSMYGGMHGNGGSSISRHNSYHSTSPHHTNFVSLNSGEFNLFLTDNEFNDVLDTWNLSEPLQSTDLKNIFKPLLNKVKKKLEFQWENNHKQVDKQILSRFWKQQFEQQQQSNSNCKRWINALKEKIPTGQYNMKQCLQSFNQTIVNSISDNLGHIVATRKRESTIDVHRAQMQMQYHQSQQAMDIDK